jgi:hypothetical protein
LSRFIKKSSCLCGYFNGSVYLNREKREMPRKGRDRFRVFWRFSRFKIMVRFYSKINAKSEMPKNVRQNNLHFPAGAVLLTG